MNPCYCTEERHDLGDNHRIFILLITSRYLFLTFTETWIIFVRLFIFPELFSLISIYLFILYFFTFS